MKTERSTGVIEYLADESTPLVAPDHMLVETARTIRRFSLGGLISDSRADSAIESAIGLGVRTYPCTDLIRKAWTMRFSITIDDALYVALGESIPGASLLTTDVRLARAASRRMPVIQL